MSIPQHIIASSFVEDAESALVQRQQAVAILIAYDTSYFIEVDNAIGNRFTQEAVAMIVNRRIELLRTYTTNITRTLGGDKYAALRNAMKERYGVTR